MRALKFSLLISLAISLCPTASATLTSFTLSGTNSANSADTASVTFSLSGDILTVTLDNTSSQTGIIHQGDVLESVFFGTSAISLTPTTAIATNGTILPNDGTNYNVGSGWGEESFTASASTNGYANYISASGLSVSGSAGDKSNFPGGNQGTGAALDGVAYGIVPSGVTALMGGPCGSSCYFAVGQVVFTLTTHLTDLTALEEEGVAFNWGTSLGPVDAAPEPSFYGALSLGMAGLWFAARYAKRRKGQL